MTIKKLQRAELRAPGRTDRWAVTQRGDHAERATIVARERHRRLGNRNTPRPVVFNRVGRQGRLFPKTPAAARPLGDHVGGNAFQGLAHLGFPHSEKSPAELGPRLRPP